jgi:hypothetical protein
MELLKKRFFVAWGLSVLVMISLSFLWHGLLLNDLIHVPQPYALFYTLGFLTYLVIGFALTFVFVYLSMGIGIRMKGGLMGMTLGFFIYLIAFIFGISFKGTGTAHVVVDFIWQMIEQGIGGGVVGFVYAMARRRDKVIFSDRQ